jgi:hypothetical protein
MASMGSQLAVRVCDGQSVRRPMRGEIDYYWDHKHLVVRRGPNDEIRVSHRRLESCFGRQLGLLIRLEGSWDDEFLPPIFDGYGQVLDVEDWLLAFCGSGELDAMDSSMLHWTADVDDGDIARAVSDLLLDDVGAVSIGV